MKTIKVKSYNKLIEKIINEDSIRLDGNTSDANECNESLLSNCRVQLALSKKKDGMILELPSLTVRKVSVR